jgi:hypothetical protein
MQVKRILLAGTLFAFGACAATSMGAPSIGGTPIHTEDDVFSGGSWGMFVSSYVFDSNSELPGDITLDPGEFLFVYLLDADDEFSVSIDTYSVGNPFDQPIIEVGAITNVVPDGFAAPDREDPWLVSYNPGSQSSVYTFANDFFDPFSTLDPTEWSLVYYIAETTGWTLGSANASGAGISDSQLVPVPIPAPGALALLGLAGLMGRRRR